MTSKERIKRLIERKEIDKIPIGFYVVDYDIIEKVIGRPTYVRNKVKTQIALWEGRRKEVAESYKNDSVDFFKKINCIDILTFKEAAFLPPKDYIPPKMIKIDEKTYKDENGGIYKISELTNEITCVYNPVKQEVKIEDFTSDMFKFDKNNIKKPDESIFEAFDYLIEKFKDEKFILGPCGGFIGITLIGGWEVGMMMYVLKPDVIQAANEVSLQYQNINDEYWIRKGQDGVLVENDMAGTKGPFISPESFRRYCFPYIKRRVENIKKHIPFVFLHNCGNNIPLMDMFIEAGIDVYQSLQTNAGMDIEFLSERFGEKIIFWGGISTEILINGTIDDVRKNVRKFIEKVKKKNLRIIFGPSHSIAYGTRYD
ncbi:MAG: uroporphyrinogen decarboxylase family protein, partial [bacterium]|nr:uroporphyrinogen decarboxylase family protein [bacterium]MDW8164752.1 uroporphyrinogen decarboxylase family protein [Candidatus Omnitrophota bacterium]